MIQFIMEMIIDEELILKVMSNPWQNLTIQLILHEPRHILSVYRDYLKPFYTKTDFRQ